MRRGAAQQTQHRQDARNVSLTTLRHGRGGSGPRHDADCAGGKRRGEVARARCGRTLCDLGRSQRGADARRHRAVYRARVPLRGFHADVAVRRRSRRRGSDYTPERMQAMGRFFRNGTFKQELVQSYASDDMVVLAVIEQTNVEVGGLPAQDWSLRVTLVYRREGADWQLGAPPRRSPRARGIAGNGGSPRARRRGPGPRVVLASAYVQR